MRGQAIPEIKMKVYHATVTYKGKKWLKSFIINGADPTIAHGFGQGCGFYVWTRQDLATYHATNFKQPDKNEYPLILIFEENINPEEWDLDYEANVFFITAFIRGNWNLFKTIPDGEIKMKENLLIPSESEKNDFMKSVTFWFRKPDGKRINTTTATKRDSYSIEDGAVLGKIFDYLQKKYPQKTQKFEESVFLLAQKSPSRGFAIKYTGTKKLKVKNLLLKVGDKWLDKEDALKYSEENKFDL